VPQQQQKGEDLMDLLIDIDIKDEKQPQQTTETPGNNDFFSSLANRQ